MQQLSTGAMWLLMFLGTAGAFAGCHKLSTWEVSAGYRDGTVRKFSHTGVVWKTWEAELLGDGMRASATSTGTQVSPETFQYSVTDPVIIEKLNSLPPGRRVRLHYSKNLTIWKPQSETQFFVTGVTELSPD